MGKLKVLRVICCGNHRSIEPIKFASLEDLKLSCHCCEYDNKKKSRRMGHREELHWDDTPLKELPFSFQDLNISKELWNCSISNK